MHKRQGLDDFLESVSKFFNIIVFTASERAYADACLDKIDPAKKYFSKRYYREHCTKFPDGFVKDLEKIN